MTGWSFTPIADSSKGVGRLVNPLFSSAYIPGGPQIDAAGDVVFVASTPETMNGVPRHFSGVYEGDGGPLTTLYERLNSNFGAEDASIAPNGIIGYAIGEENSGYPDFTNYGSQIFAVKDGNTSVLVGSLEINPTSPYPVPEGAFSLSINNSGGAVINGLQGSLGDGNILFSDGKGGAQEPNYDARLLVSRGYVDGFVVDAAGVSINADKTAAVVAQVLPTGGARTTSAVLTIKDGLLTPIAITGGAFSRFFTEFPSINDLGTVAFVAQTAQGGTELVSGTADHLSVDAETSDLYSSIFPTAVSINNTGTVAFEATLKDGRTGIFLGPNPTTVIATGDSLLGSKVTGLLFNSSRGLNSANQVVFTATLADGRKVIVRADPVQGTDLAATQPTRSAVDGGVDFGYTINGANLLNPPIISLYWASGTTFDTILPGGPIASPPATKTAQGATESFHVIPSLLADVPSGAKYLLAVVNQPGSHHISEIDDPADANNVKSLPLSITDIALQKAKDLSPNSISVDYTISNAAVTKPIQFNVYQTATAPKVGVAYVPNANELVDTATLSKPSDFSTGSHTGVSLALPKPLTSDPTRPYFVVVANPSGPNHFTESDESNGSDPNNTAYFQLSTLALQSINWHPSTEQEWSGQYGGVFVESGVNAGGVDIAYTINGVDLPQAAPIALYWVDSSGKKLSGAIITGDNGGNLVTQTAANTSVQSSYVVHVPALQLGIPPTNSRGLMVALDPSDSALYVPVAYVDNGSSAVNTLDASPTAILKNSVHVAIRTSGTEIDAVFMPASGLSSVDTSADISQAQGALDLAQAEAICGVDHFNWIQHYTSPSYITYYRNSIAPANLVAAPGQPVLDPDNVVNDATYFFMYSSFANQGHVFDPMPVDSYVFYYDELNSRGLDYYQFHQDQSPNPFELKFYDAPIYPKGYLKPSDYNLFDTTLVGVKNYTPVTLDGSGQNLNFTWKSNVAVDASRNTTGYIWQRYVGSPDRPTITEGGIFDAKVGGLFSASQPPVLSAISDQQVNEGVKLSLTATSNADPGKVLTYSLDPGAPVGTTINSRTGDFVWTPASPGVFTVTVRATDNSSPPLSSFKTFKITVNDIAPMIDLGATVVASQGTSFSWVGSLSSTAAGVFSATVNYGDGTGLQPLALAPSQTFSLSHTYALSGTFTVTVAVTDPFGQVGTQTEKVVVTPYVSGFGTGRDAFVTTLYNQVLGRAPEPAGLSFWSKQLASKVKPKTVAISFWVSRERHILLSEHKAPPIAFGRVLNNAAHASKNGAVHPTGKATVKTFAARHVAAAHH